MTLKALLRKQIVAHDKTYYDTTQNIIFRGQDVIFKRINIDSMAH